MNDKKDDDINEEQIADYYKDLNSRTVHEEKEQAEQEEFHVSSAETSPKEQPVLKAVETPPMHYEHTAKNDEKSVNFFQQK